MGPDVQAAIEVMEEAQERAWTFQAAYRLALRSDYRKYGTVTTDLPPRPDPYKGEPRPPRAPVNPREENDEPEPKQPYHSKKVLPGPEGGGPPLEWHYGDRRMQWWFSGVTVVACLLLAVFKSGWAWAGEWYVWAVLAAFGLIAWILPKGHKISAGADWLNTRGEIVRIYELTAVKLKGTAGGYNIHLYDVHGHEADTGLDLMYANRDLWDLVYNGIRHSVAHGAQTDALTRSKLQLGREHHEQDSGS